MDAEDIVAAIDNLNESFRQFAIDQRRFHDDVLSILRNMEASILSIESDERTKLEVTQSIERLAESLDNHFNPGSVDD